MFWTAIGGASVGLLANVWAYSERKDIGDLSHADRVSRNDTIHELNIAAVVSYSVATAAAATWLCLKLWPGESTRRLGLAPTADASGTVVSFETAW